MTLNVNNNVVINEALGHRTHHSCKPVINKTNGDFYVSATDAAEALGVSVHSVSVACLGRSKSCKGNRLEYLDHTSGNVNSLLAEVRRLYAENERLRKDAKIGRYLRILANEERAQKALEQARNERKRAKAK